MTVCERVGGYARFKTSTTFVMFAWRKICRDLTALSLLEVGVFSTRTLSTLLRNYHILEVSNVPLVCKKNWILWSKDLQPYVTLQNFLARGFCSVLRSVRALGWKRLHCTVGYLTVCEFLLWAVQDTGFDKALWHETEPCGRPGYCALGGQREKKQQQTFWKGIEVWSVTKQETLAVKGVTEHGCML